MLTESGIPTISRFLTKSSFIFVVNEQCITTVNTRNERENKYFFIKSLLYNYDFTQYTHFRHYWPVMVIEMLMGSYNYTGIVIHNIEEQTKNSASRCDNVAEARPKSCDRTPKAPSRGWYRFFVCYKETVCEVVVFFYLSA